jgi:hypothetical protein
MTSVQMALTGNQKGASKAQLACSKSDNARQRAKCDEAAKRPVTLAAS